MKEKVMFVRMLNYLRLVFGVFLMCLSVAIMMTASSLNSMAQNGSALLMATIGVFFFYQSWRARKNVNEDEEDVGTFVHEDFFLEEEE